MRPSIGSDHVEPGFQRRLSACRYVYDALGVLSHTVNSGQTGVRFWRGERVVNELCASAGGDIQLTWLRAMGQPIVEELSGIASRVTMLATAVGGSVLLEADTAVRTVGYAPHGSRPDRDEIGAAQAEPAFNGEPLDAASGCYLLGAGHHRPYSPTLGMFLAPDSASPFGAGGLNSLSYCAGDPVNRADPTGHFWKWVVAAVGVAFGVAAVVASFGAASLAVSAVLAGGFAALTKSGAAAIAAVTLGTLAVGTEVGAAIALSAGDTKTGAILGWVGMGLGVVGSLPGIAKAAARGVAKLSRFSQRLGSVRTPRLSATFSQVRTSALPEMSPYAVRRTLQWWLHRRRESDYGTISNLSRRGSTTSAGSMSSAKSISADLVPRRSFDPVGLGGVDLDNTVSSAWKARDAIPAPGGPRATTVNVDDHFRIGETSGPELGGASPNAVRRLASMRPSGYDDAVLGGAGRATSRSSFSERSFRYGA